MGGMTDDWEQSLAAVVAAGADAVEVGHPLLGPDDGRAGDPGGGAARAQRGTVPDEVLDGIARAEAPVPVAVMTYYNIVFRAGHKRMARSLAAAGVSGAILAGPPHRGDRPLGGRGGRGGHRHRAAGGAVEPARAGRAHLRPGARLRLRRGAHGRDRRAGRPRGRRGEGGRAHPALHATCRSASGSACPRRPRRPRCAEVADGVVVGFGPGAPPARGRGARRRRRRSSGRSARRSTRAAPRSRRSATVPRWRRCPAAVGCAARHTYP